MSNNKFALLVATTVLVLGLGASRAFADDVTNLGVIYSLSSALVSSTGTTQTYDVTLTVNTTGYTGSGTDLLVAAAVKVDSGVDSASLIGSPSSAWSFASGGTNSGGCDMAGSGFVCATTSLTGARFPSGVGVGHTNGGTFSWVWLVTVATGTLDEGGTLGSVKAVYYNSTGTSFTHQTSEADGNSIVPEPTAMILMGTFLLLAAWGLGRKLTA